MQNLSWSPWSPAKSSNTLRAYQASTHRVRGIMGPMGGGKTICALSELFWIGYRQAADVDGVRRTRHLVLRDTYGTLEDTTLKSFEECYPQPDEPGVKGVTSVGGGNRRTVYNMVCSLQDGTSMSLEIIFAAVGDKKAEQFMKGFELTSLFLSEGDGLDPEILQFGLGRIGRYPSKKTGEGASWRGVTIDFNAPTYDNYLHEVFSEGDPSLNKLFTQPSGLSAEAENIEFLVKDYYADLIKLNTKKWVKRNIKNQWGNSDAGEPVFDEFNVDTHVSDVNFEPIKGLPIYVGLDAGRRPCAIFAQVDHEGQLRIIDEFVKVKMGATTFGPMLKEYIVQNFGWEWDFIGIGDPNAGNKTESCDEDWLELMTNLAGFKVKAAKTNTISLRLEAVSRRFLLNIRGDKPKILIAPKCVKLIKGLTYAYIFDKSGEKPLKNEASDPQDSLQYICLEITTHAELVGKSLSKRPAQRPKPKQRSLMSTKPRRRGRR